MEERAVVKILKYSPDVDSVPYYKEFQVPFHQEDTVLDALVYIYENLDGSIGFRYSCKQRLCMGCRAKVNGKSVLTCKAQMLREVTIEPLDTYEVIRDLTVDFSTKKKINEEIK